MLEHQLIGYLDSVRAKQPLPIRVKLWNDHVINLDPNPLVTIVLRRPWAARYLFNPSLDALGSAYVEGEIEIEGSVRDMMRVADILAKQGSKPDERGTRPAFWWTRHSKKSDIEAIQHHYDVSNQFYSYWLDRDMVYSCAYFRSGDESLEQAQQQKLDLVCRKLMLQPGDRLLDIGCGWAALVIHAALHYQVKATGITLSRQQLEFGRDRLRALGLEHAVELRLQDYRDLDASERFDKIASVGMFEHVGLRHLKSYFDVLYRLLSPGGIALNHGITSSDADSRSVGQGGGKFIDKYVFPNGELPHLSLAIAQMSRAGLEVTDVESLRRHYAKTLWHWSDRYEQNLDLLRNLAGEKRARVWRIYLAGCAHAFASGWINIYQVQAIKPKVKSSGQTSPLPLSRDYLFSPP